RANGMQWRKRPAYGGGPSWRANRWKSAVLALFASLALVLVGDLFAVFAQLGDQLVEQHVDGGIHVGLGGLGMQGTADHAQGAVGALLELVEGEHDHETFELVVEAGEAVELGGGVIAQRGSDFNLLAAELELHGRLLWWCSAAFAADGRAGVGTAATHRQSSLGKGWEHFRENQVPVPVTRWPVRRCRSAGALAFAGCGNAQSLPVFGDGAAGHLDALGLQFLGN